jgi:hypothetical protein
MRNAILLMLGTLVAGCAPGGSPDAATRADTVTQGARDSAVARSGLPGAGAVGRAQDAASAAQERAARLDSLQQ